MFSFLLYTVLGGSFMKRENLPCWNILSLWNMHGGSSCEKIQGD